MSCVFWGKVLDSSYGDCHAVARVSFACSLYYEARGDESKALELLSNVAAEARDEGDAYMRDLARCHQRVLMKRVAATAVPLVGASSVAGAAAAAAAASGFVTPCIIKGRCV